MEYIANKFDTLEDFKTGTILLIDKPIGFTSFDAVNKIRWLIRKKLNVKKIKVGHAGTLDPLATGLLVICTGKMTKQIPFMIGDDKTYKAKVFIGKTTASFDAETELEGDYETSHITDQLIQETAASFIGRQEQTPPIYSAKKINGKRAYLSAREGEKVEMKKSEIEIFNIDVTNVLMPEIELTVHSSKGTYIRSLANDFGARMNSGGYLAGLVRTKSGEFSLENAMTLAEFEEKIKTMN